MTDYFLGVDAGGSRTRAVISSAQGEILGKGYGGAANFHTASFAASAAAIQSAVSQASTEAGSDRVSVACIGSAGLEEPGSEAEGRKLLGAVIQADEVLYDTDAYIAWAGALELQPGAIVIAGTGSIGLAIDAQGQRYRVGGWGPEFGDEGSAYALARAAIREALKSLDGRQTDKILVEAVLTFAGLSKQMTSKTASELTAWLYHRERSAADIARFSPILDKLAEQEHLISQHLLNRAGEDLAKLALALALQLQTPIKISSGGSVLSESQRVRKTFLTHLANRGLSYSEPTFSPVKGAVLLALAHKLTLAPEIFKNLKTSG